MFKSRMLDNVKLSRYIPPIWLAVLISIGFIHVGEIFAGIGMIPIWIIIGTVLAMANPTADRATVMEVFGHYSIFFQLGSFFFMAVLVFLWVKFREKRTFSSLGFFKEGWLKELGRGFLIGAAQFSLVVALLLLTGAGSLELAELSLEPVLFILALIPFWILQGGTEELVTRGWLFPAVSAKSNIFIGILISSALFGALHLLNTGVTVLSIVTIILDGIFACLLMIKYDNMWVLAGMHGAWNFVQGNVYGIQVSGQGANASIFNYTSQASIDWLSGGAFGAEGSIFATIVLIGCIAYLYWSLKKENRLPRALMLKK
ncbi:CPBP family intramembrane glutamic endopeptidase [Streptococcus cristatus]|uniref:CAAX amino terminal protease family n=1 Tax=Streptococcus cristatus TaxID=45634 RepID=A0A139N1E0_STRCR|nr:CPBP family intramembrane glutamic endopeptidase [Streptococcus cristatus]KXT69846.1 CAAX amino terminal protease family [Streptococcus cristatus]